jgi:hypothetical protein
MKKCTTCGHNELPTWAYETCIDCMQAYVKKALEQEGEIVFAEVPQKEIEALIKQPVKIKIEVQADVQSKLVF